MSVLSNKFIIIYRAKGSKQRFSIWDKTPLEYGEALKEVSRLNRKYGWNREFVAEEI